MVLPVTLKTNLSDSTRYRKGIQHPVPLLLAENGHWEVSGARTHSIGRMLWLLLAGVFDVVEHP